ncbi:MAG: hypothetical protein WCC71_23285, partial [Candidatus Sulfotelmatobacter sp.]
PWKPFAINLSSSADANITTCQCRVKPLLPSPLRGLSPEGVLCFGVYPPLIKAYHPFLKTLGGVESEIQLIDNEGFTSLK